MTKRNTPSDQVRFCLSLPPAFMESKVSVFFFLLQRTQIFVVSISKQLLIVVVRFNSGNFSCDDLARPLRERERDLFEEEKRVSYNESEFC